MDVGDGSIADAARDLYGTGGWVEANSWGFANLAKILCRQACGRVGQLIRKPGMSPLDRPMSASQSLTPVLGERIAGLWKHQIDLLAPGVVRPRLPAGLTCIRHWVCRTTAQRASRRQELGCRLGKTRLVQLHAQGSAS